MMIPAAVAGLLAFLLIPRPGGAPISISPGDNTPPAELALLGRRQLTPQAPATVAPATFAGRTIAILGAGMMAEAIIRGLMRGGLVEASQIVTSHPRAERRTELASSLGIRVLESNAEITSNPFDSSDLVMIRTRGWSSSTTSTRMQKA